MTLIPYKTTPVWNIETLPQALRNPHNTKAGTWGKLNIIKGECTFYELQDENGAILQTHHLTPQSGVWTIPPQAWHKVEPLTEDFEMQIEFHCEPADYFHKTLGMTAIHSAVKAATALVPPCKTLDLGCGQGRNALPLALMGYEVTAVDHNPAATAEVVRLAAAHELSVEAYPYDIHDADIDGEYDLIIATVVFMFLQRDRIPAIIADMQAKTRAGGYNLIVCAMNTADYPCNMPFSFTFSEGELRDYYQDWTLHTYEEAPGKMHATDAHGNPIELKFVTMLAQKA